MWNWAKTIPIVPAARLHPPFLADVRRYVRDMAARSRGVRPYANLYSFSHCIDAPDIAIDIGALKTVALHLPGDPLLEAGAFSAPDVKAVAWAQAGATINAVCLAATQGGLAFAPFTLGGSTGQTLIGAISTSTHGGDFEHHPLPDYVLALHLITPSGDVWIERAGPQPVADDAAVARMLGVTTAAIRFVRTPGAIEAVVVALGAAGIIGGVLLALREDALMNERVHLSVPWARVRAALADGSALHTAPGDDPAAPVPGLYRYLEVMLNGYDTPATCIVCARNERPADGIPRPVLVRGQLDLIRFAAAYAGPNPDCSAALRTLVQGARLTGNNSHDASGWVFHRSSQLINTGVPSPMPVYSYELVWPVTALIGGEPAYLKFLDRAIVEIHGGLAPGRRPYAGTLSLRFTRGTSALLGMQYAADPATARFAHVEVSCLQNVFDNDSALPRQNQQFLEAVFSDPSVALCHPHWGQGELGGLALDARSYPQWGRWRAELGALLGRDAAVFQTAWTRKVGATP